MYKEKLYFRDEEIFVRFWLIVLSHNTHLISLGASTQNINFDIAKKRSYDMSEDSLHRKLKTLLLERISSKVENRILIVSLKRRQ